MAAAAAAAQEEQATAFTAVKQILADRCSGCHDWAGAPEGLAGRGLVVPGDAENSVLYQMVSSDAMPKAGPKLTADQKEIIRAWIAAGAGGPASGEAPAAALPVQSRPAVNIPLHEISGFTSSGLLLAAGVVGIVHFLSLMEQGHAYRDAIGFQEGGPESVRAAAIQSVWNDPSQQTLRWWHVGLLSAGELFYAYNAFTGVEMISDPQPGVLTRADIHRWAFYTHATLMAAQIVLGFFSTYALSPGYHDLLVGLGAAHATIGIAIPVVMVGAGILNMLP